VKSLVDVTDAALTQAKVAAGYGGVAQFHSISSLVKMAPLVDAARSSSPETREANFAALAEASVLRAVLAAHSVALTAAAHAAIASGFVSLELGGLPQMRQEARAHTLDTPRRLLCDPDSPAVAHIRSLVLPKIHHACAMYSPQSMLCGSEMAAFISTCYKLDGAVVLAWLAAQLEAAADEEDATARGKTLVGRCLRLPVGSLPQLASTYESQVTAVLGSIIAPLFLVGPGNVMETAPFIKHVSNLNAAIPDLFSADAVATPAAVMSFFFELIDPLAMFAKDNPHAAMHLF
jgi:hypothetical protein